MIIAVRMHNREARHLRSKSLCPLVHAEDPGMPNIAGSGEVAPSPFAATWLGVGL